MEGTPGLVLALSSRYQFVPPIVPFNGQRASETRTLPASARRRRLSRHRPRVAAEIDIRNKGSRAAGDHRQGYDRRTWPRLAAHEPRQNDIRIATAALK